MTQPETTEQTAKRLAQRKKYVHKEPKSINMSHEAFLLFRQIAESRHLGVGDLFEILMQEEAERRLTREEREHIQQKSAEITRSRQAEVRELEQTLQTD